MIFYATNRYGFIVTSDNTLKHHYINSLCVIKLYRFLFFFKKTFPVRISFCSASNEKSTPSVSCFERKSMQEKETSAKYIAQYIYSFASIVLRTYTFFSPTITKFCEILLQTAFIMLNELVHYWDLCWLKYNHVTNDRTKNHGLYQTNLFLFCQ